MPPKKRALFGSCKNTNRKLKMRAAKRRAARNVESEEHRFRRLEADRIAQAVARAKRREVVTSTSLKLQGVAFVYNSDSQSLSRYPVSTFSPTVQTHQTSVPLQSLTRTMPHPSTVMSQPISSVPCSPTHMQQPILPLQFPVLVQHSLSSLSSQQHSSLLNQNKASVDRVLCLQFPVSMEHSLSSSSSQQHSILLNQNKASVDQHTSLQQCSTSEKNNLVSLQHLTSSSIHHNPLSAWLVPYLPSDSSTEENGSLLLPKPIVKGSVKDDGSVVISWNLTLLDNQPDIAFYQIYSCQEQDDPEGPPIWNSVGDVASLDLPMACTLRQFEENARYHFAIRIVDKSKRYGPFSDPVTILYQKGKDSSQRNSVM